MHTATAMFLVLCVDSIKMCMKKKKLSTIVDSNNNGKMKTRR